MCYNTNCAERWEDTEYKLHGIEFWIHSLPSFLLPQPVAPSPNLSLFGVSASGSPRPKEVEALPGLSLSLSHVWALGKQGEDGLQVSDGKEKGI